MIPKVQTNKFSSVNFEDENLKVESFLVDHHPVKEALGLGFFW